ncbi:hypothetical protein [Krasilnikovia sp. M28-CT-15]|uniref:hypothetical protein n=1 Tax=Krasilnikovia sp. M28-CT-15 TaxID=3373540 RepID=UPI0038770BA0
MKFTESLKRFFGEMATVPDLARSGTVAALVPADAQYVTVGPIAVLPDVRAFNRGAPGTRYGRDLGYLRSGTGQQIALLVLTRDQLVVIGSAGLRWSCQLTEVTDLDGHRKGGFLVFTSRPEGLAVGQQTPVQVPPGAGFRTVHGMTNLFSGWDAALAPFGVRHQF